ncbi:MAG: hypothetical protein N3F03_02085, partial [Ignavibacteria bacterium]|nr:hypothetical protein [Ignavibacteria bacterium]
IFLNQKERGFELLDFMLKYQFPANWNHWAEVVWRDSSKPEFIGDMPHTWVGSDFINAFRNMIVYEDENEKNIKLLMGFTPDFLNEKNVFEVVNMITIFGKLNIHLKKFSEQKIVVNFLGNLDVGEWKFELFNPFNKTIKNVYLNGKQIFSFDNKKIEFKEFPATLEIIYF